MSLANFGGTGFSMVDLEAMPLPAREELLAEVIISIRAQQASLKQKLQEAETMVRERMLADDAKIADAGAYEIKLVRTLTRNEYDIEGLTQLVEFVPAAMFAAALKPTFTVDKRALNEIEKRGGPAKEIIDQSVLPHYRYELDLKKRLTADDYDRTIGAHMEASYGR